MDLGVIPIVHVSTPDISSACSPIHYYDNNSSYCFIQTVVSHTFIRPLTVKEIKQYLYDMKSCCEFRVESNNLN